MGARCRRRPPETTLSYRRKHRSSAAAYTGFELSLTANLGSVVQLFFKTALEPTFSAAKSLSTPLVAGSHVYAFDFSVNPAWTGTVTQLRLDPSNAATSVSLDYIRPLVSSSLPAPPSALTAIAENDDQMILHWNDHSGNERGFVLERSLDGVNFTQIVQTPANVTSALDFGLKPERNYHYQVKAVNSHGSSAYAGAQAQTAAVVASDLWFSPAVGAADFTQLFTAPSAGRQGAA